MSTIVSSSSSRTSPLASLGGLVHPLTTCFKLFPFFSSSAPSCLSLPQRNVWERCISETKYVTLGGQGGSESARALFLFPCKKKKMKKITSSVKQETENKKINEPSWSPLDRVTSRVTQQHSRRYFQPDLTISWSGIDVAAAASFSRHAGHTCFCSRHMQS